MKLRDYQNELVNRAAGSDNVLIQADTGSGKTPVLAKITRRERYVLLIAHRNILIRQISKTLAIHDVKHSVVATIHTQRQCELEHRKLGLSGYLAGNSNYIVCSIDSLLSRHRRGRLALDTQKPWVIIVDEAHHMIEDNKWGKLTAIFPFSRLIGATATPCRLDGRSLARSKGGVFDRLEQADSLKHESVRRLIERGYLSDFKPYSLPEHIKETNLTKGSAGDYTYKTLCEETDRVKYTLIGDAVTHYKRLADGRQALAFAVSIEIAKETAKMFRQAGIPAAAIHSKQSYVETTRVFELFQNKQIKVLVNVDMIGEGVDVPAIEVLIMLRKTASFGMYRQWVGRALRPDKNKDHAIILDHTGNMLKHGLPDKHISWSLENPPKAEKSNLIPCPFCGFLNFAWLDICADCGGKIRRKGQSSKQDGTTYIDEELVKLKRKEIDKALQKQAIEKDLSENLKIPHAPRGSMPSLQKKVAEWVANELQEAGITTRDINRFLLSVEHTSNFWIHNFTLADLNKNSSKCIMVYNKWLKSK